jgi:hypothetical protein
MPRVLVDVAADGGFGLPQWLALLGAALLSVCVAVFLCGSSTGGGGKASASQEMAHRTAAAASSTTVTSCEEAPELQIASRCAAAASTATGAGGDPERSHGCAGCP